MHPAHEKRVRIACCVRLDELIEIPKGLAKISALHRKWFYGTVQRLLGGARARRVDCAYLSSS